MIRFVVPGWPAPKGSLKLGMRFGKGGVKRPILRKDNPRTDVWQALVSREARAAFAGPPCDGPVVVDVVFYVERPKSAPRSRVVPCVKPDIDKLSRSTLDALIGIVVKDDALVVQLVARKEYATKKPGALITVRQWQPSDASTAIAEVG